jgi:hypothetical protein
MSRKKIYHTEAERLAAQKARAKAYYHKNKKQIHESVNKWILDQGFAEPRDYLKTTKSYKSNLIGTEPGKFKETYNVLPSDCKEIPNYPTYYAQPCGEVWRWSEKRRCYLNIKQQEQKTGYKVVQIYDETNKRRVRFVHILMMETFVGPRPVGDIQVDHINHIRQDNNITNLRWLTRSANLKRRKRWSKK